MSGAPDNAMMARIRLGAEAKVRAELSLAAPPLLAPPSSQPVDGAAGGRSGLPGISGTVPATSSTSIGCRPPGCLGASPVNPGEPQRGITTSSSQSTSDPEVTLVGGADGKESAARKAPTRWSVEEKRILMLQVVADKPFLAKDAKGVKLLAAWDELAATISTVPDFAHEGVTGRGCQVKYKEMIAAHRQEVKNGEFTSGVRVGMDDATHEALNTCMQQEDEAEENAAKSKGEIAAIEEAKQERAEKVHAYATKSSGSGARKKRRVSGSGSTSSGNPFSDEDEESTLPKRRSAPSTVQLEHSVARYFANQVDSDETKARKLAIAESAARTAERQSVARKAESRAMLKMLSAQTDAATANTQRKAEQARLRADESKAKIARKAEEAKSRAAESEAQRQFMLQMASMMGKLAEKL